MALGVQLTKALGDTSGSSVTEPRTAADVPKTSWEPATARSLRILGRGWSAYAQAPELQVFTDSRDLCA